MKKPQLSVQPRSPDGMKLPQAHRCAYVLHTGSAVTEKRHPMLMPRGLEEEEQKEKELGLKWLRQTDTELGLDF